MENIKSLNKYSLQILFACTNLSQNSTFVKYFKTLHQEITKYVPEFLNVPKVAQFVYKLPSDAVKNLLEDKYGYQLLSSNQYMLDRMEDQSVIEFLANHPKLKVDAIVLSQCSNLIDTISFEQYNFLDKKIIFENIKTFYHGLTPHGFIFNFYYYPFRDPSKLSLVEINKEKIRKLNPSFPILVKFENFYSPNVFEHIDLFIFLVRVMNRLFQNISTGVYQKIPMTESSLDLILETEYEMTVLEIAQIMESNKEFLEEFDKRYLGSYHPEFTKDVYDHIEKFISF